MLIDQCLGRRGVAAALVADGATVRLHADEFEADAADADWLPIAGARGWIVVTKDVNLRKRPLELAAILAARLRVFALTSAQLGGAQQAQAFAAAAKKMRRVSRQRGPFIGFVSPSGAVTVEYARALTRRLRRLRATGRSVQSDLVSS